MKEESDTSLMRRAAFVIALQTVLAVTLVLVLVGVLVYTLYVRQQTRDNQRLLSETVSNADDVNDPPSGIILLTRTATGVQAHTRGAPDAVIKFDLASLPNDESRATIGDVKYEVDVRDEDGVRTVGLIDRTSGEEEEKRLAVALLAAGFVGIVFAAIASWVLGLRAVRPLGTALGLQRQFVADASHELRTPLTVIHTRAQLLRRRMGEDASEQQKRELDQLVRDSRAMGDVISDLLLSAELHSGAASGIDVDLGVLAHEIVSSLIPYADSRGIDLVAQVSDNPDDPNLIVKGVEVALRRASTALIDNAVGHTPAHGHVVVQVRRVGDLVWMAVRDDGEGLDPADGDRLTQRFARGDHAPGRGRRFGLGLALVAEVVRAHDGELDISGTPGEGATFTMKLPASTS